ncbi:hypothetical protein COE58_25855 [Bacillus cereus]|nr:hypothetical protein COE58_25855 [Bacillus cereus]
MRRTKITTEDFMKLLTNSLYKSEKKVEEIIQSIMNILGLKDHYTKGHSERVAKYSKILAKKSNQYDEAALSNFYFASLLHDIGKLGISNKILNKTTYLTNDEYNVIKTHPKLGVKLIKSLSLNEEGESVIRSHHERWDGSGYPDGLKNNEIPYGARIVSLADTFDAMTSTRAYRPALSPEEAYKRIIEGAGTQFDPELVEDFKMVYPSWIRILESSLC